MEERNEYRQKEHMLAMVLALQKHLHTYSQNMLTHSWLDAGSVTSIEGSETLVLGLGDIGQAFCRKMKALGSHVTGIRRNISRKPDCVDDIYTLDYLEELLTRMDIVAVILPGSEENYHLFSFRGWWTKLPWSRLWMKELWDAQALM